MPHTKLTPTKEGIRETQGIFYKIDLNLAAYVYCTLIFINWYNWYIIKYNNIYRLGVYFQYTKTFHALVCCAITCYEV